MDEVLNGVVTGKMTPIEAADYLDAAASKSEEEIDRAAKLHPIRRRISIAFAWIFRQ